MIVAIILISALLMAVFLAAAIAGNRAHDRQNARLEASRAALSDETESDDPEKTP